VRGYNNKVNTYISSEMEENFISQNQFTVILAMDTKNTNLLNGRRHRSVGVMKPGSVTWHHEKCDTWSLKHWHINQPSYRREPEPVVITDDVTSTQTLEKDQPSSDNKMNNNQNKYIWIKTNEGGPHEVTWEVIFGEHWPHQESLESRRHWINKSIDVTHFRTYRKTTSGMIRQSNGKHN
jgi:hypothetical protein